MPKWLLNQRVLFAPNDDWGNSTWWWDKETDSSNTPNEEAGKEKEDLTSIPKYRFDEVNEKRKAAEAELAKYKEAEVKKAEEEALKRWEYEKIISQKDQEIADFKKQQEAWKVREEVVKSKNEERLQKLEKEFGENWNSVKGLVDDITDPFVLSGKLDSLEAMKWAKVSNGQKWWWDISNWWTSRKQELMEKLRKEWSLTAKERQELLTATSN